MPSISSLLVQPPQQGAVIPSEGYTVWLVWSGELDPSVQRTLQDYGGLCVASETYQALWFFFTNDALLALAKLEIWGKYNSQTINILAFPGILQVGVGQALSLSLEENLARQDVSPPESGIAIWVHPQVERDAANLPGLTFTLQDPEAGMARFKWVTLSADSRLPYLSTQGWYSILRPLGNPFDKSFQAGWRFLFARLERILHERKLKYSINDNFLMLPLENLGNLRIWLKELLFALEDIKEQSPDHYWPCVTVVVDRRRLNFNAELPNKINVNWDTLTPDYPFLSYRNAFLLGRDFSIQDRFYSTGNNSIEHWCTVGLQEVERERSGMPVLLPAHLLSGNKHCFYCGVRTHDSHSCPSRHMPPVRADFWSHYSDLDLETMNQAFRVIETRMTKEAKDVYGKLLVSKGPEARVLEGLFSIYHVLQLRTLPRIWMLAGRDIDAEPDPAAIRDESPAWNLLGQLVRSSYSDLPHLEKQVATQLSSRPRDWKLQSLLGFVAMERGDYHKAIDYWRQAELISSFISQQGWHIFLQAHALELTGKFTEAIERYEDVKRILPYWRRIQYRQLVCRVKMGFGQSLKGDVFQLVKESPEVFNQLLLDPDLLRGRAAILNALSPLWAEGEKLSQREKGEVERLAQDIDNWFPEGNEEADALKQRLENLLARIDTKNYLSFVTVGSSRPQIEKDLEALIQKEIDVLTGRYKGFLTTMEAIRDEASWFPFQKALVEFNRLFNEAARMVNWAFTSDFHLPDVFNKAKNQVEQMGTLLKKLEQKLNMLRLARDGTLFTLILMKTFLWIEMIALVLTVLAMAGLLLFGELVGLSGLQRVIKVNFWDLQQVLFVIISLSALGIAALRATLTFEKRRDRLLEEAKEQREQLQQERLERAYIRGDARRKQAQRNLQWEGE